jgi:hypothetical protein
LPRRWPYSDPGYLRSGQGGKTHPVSKNRAKRRGPKGWFAHAMFTPFQGVAAGAGAGVPLFPGTRKNGVRAERLPDSSKGLPCAGWCHPLRRSGIMVTRRLFGFEARAKGSWCGRRDLNPHGPCGPTDFRTRLRLSPPPLSCRRVWGLDYPFTVSRMCFRLSGAARLVSTPSRPECSGRAWLGIAMLQGSPNLSSSASPVSLRALKFALKSDASADSATPA